MWLASLCSHCKSSPGWFDEWLIDCGRRLGQSELTNNNNNNNKVHVYGAIIMVKRLKPLQEFTRFFHWTRAFNSCQSIALLPKLHNVLMLVFSRRCLIYLHTYHYAMRTKYKTIYRVAQNKIPHQIICNIFATGGQNLKIVEAV